MPVSSTEDRDGRSRHEDIEVVTGHYRGAHAGAVAESGFTCYRVDRRHGRRLRERQAAEALAHPRIAEELLG